LAGKNRGGFLSEVLRDRKTASPECRNLLEDPLKDLPEGPFQRIRSTNSVLDTQKEATKERSILRKVDERTQKKKDAERAR